jgi:septal ring factor EnvC (AmiA/AmiB activator)
VWQKYNAKAKEVELLQAKLFELQDEIKYLKEENKELMEQLLQS